MDKRIIVDQLLDGDELFSFAEEGDNEHLGRQNVKTPVSDHDEARVGVPWKILVLDDEADVHAVSRLALRNFSFMSRELTILQAFSAEEAKGVFAQHPDIAMILLDVIMETPTAGLEFVKYLRETLGNCFCRIILRTGQPGQVPERTVISTYDIDDYKTKTELSADKLITTVITSLRSFRTLCELDHHRRHLEEMVQKRTAEIEVLLNQTLTGSVKLLVEILSQTSPLAFARSQRLAKIAKKISEKVSGKRAWEVQMAAMLSQIGCVVIPEELLKKGFSGRTLSAKEQAVFDTYPQVGQKLLQYIPNLKTIAASVALQNSPDAAKDEEADVCFISQLLYILNRIDCEIEKGESLQKGLDTVLGRHLQFDPEIVNLVKVSVNELEALYVVAEVPLRHLVVGSVLVKDIVDVNGRVLVTKGHQVSELLRYRLLNWHSIQDHIREPIVVAVKKA